MKFELGRFVKSGCYNTILIDSDRNKRHFTSRFNTRYCVYL